LQFSNRRYGTGRYPLAESLGTVNLAVSRFQEVLTQNTCRYDHTQNNSYYKIFLSVLKLTYHTKVS